METELAQKCGDFTRFVTRQTRKLFARAIPYGSYAEPLAARVLLMMGLGVLAGTTLWMLVASSIL